MLVLHADVSQAQDDDKTHHQLGEFVGGGDRMSEEVAEDDIRRGEKHHHRQDATPHTGECLAYRTDYPVEGLGCFIKPHINSLSGYYCLFIIFGYNALRQIKYLLSGQAFAVHVS